jgi:nucleoside-diphosphate-sugar epimerase
MRVLVTGGTGFIGSHFVDRLLRDGHHVRCLVRPTSDRRWLTGKPVELVECDRIGDPVAARQVVGDAELVFHGLGTLIARNLQAYRQVNVEPVRHLLDACVQSGSVRRFVLVGSHGAAGPNRQAGERISEKDPCHPVSDYGRSKLEAEQVTAEYRGRVPYTIVRLSAVYGPRDVNFLRFFKSAYHRGTVLQLGRQPKAVSLGYVRDVVEGICLAATAQKALNQTYFLSGGEACSVQDLRDAMTAAMGRKVEVRVVPNLVVRALMLWADVRGRLLRRDVLLSRDRLATMFHPWWVCDISRARAELGYSPAVSLAEGVRETYDWYRENGWL